MKLTRNLITLSAISALSFGLMACSDDSSSDDTPEIKAPICEGNTAVTYDQTGKATKTDCTTTNQVCKAGKCVKKDDVTPSDKKAKCEGDVAVTYDQNGKETKTNCAEKDQICRDGACVAKDTPAEPKCTEKDNKCEGDTLVKCGADGKLVKTVCKAGCDSQKLECNAVPECDHNTYQATCTNATTQHICNESNAYQDVPCGEGNRCNSTTGECEKDPCASCKATEICENDKCVSQVKESVIGVPCTCEGDDCDAGIVVTGEELTALIKSEGLPIAIAGIVGGIVPKTAKITAPNFFSKSIKGCDKINAPEGMTVGCFRDSKIVFNEDAIKILTTVQSVLPLAIGAIPGLKEKMEASGITTEKINDAIKLLIDSYIKPGIQFTSPNGYCMTAAIDIKATVNEDPNNKLSSMINTDAANTLMSKLNTGDHEKAKTAKCPEGSVLMTYSIDKADAAIGSANVGFDMCLKQCITDDDCRKADGYKCIEMPNGVPTKDETGKEIPVKTEKVCFDEKNITYFQNMTNAFKSEDQATGK